TEAGRGAWLKKLPAAKRWAAETLFEELDAQTELRQQLEKDVVRESHKHPIAKKLETCPGFGEISAWHRRSHRTPRGAPGGCPRPTRASGGRGPSRGPPRARRRDRSTGSCP